MSPKLVHRLTCLSIDIAAGSPLGLLTRVEGLVGSPGWTGFVLHHHICLRPPLDGIYEADMVAVPPPGAAGPETAFTFDETWASFPSAHLLGLRVHAATNSLTVLLS